MENENKNQNADTQTATNTNVQKEEQKENVNKNEGEKAKNKVAQKGEDGSIVFKNQDELDGFIRRMYAKGAEKAEQGETPKKVQETQEKQEETKDYTDKIALAMAKAGVDVKKVERAAKLVDVSKILENGVLNAKNLEDEINAVLAEFPELKVAKEEEKEEKGFKFGADQGSTDKDQKQKRPTPTKRWNRFNSF